MMNKYDFRGHDSRRRLARALRGFIAIDWRGWAMLLGVASGFGAYLLNYLVAKAPTLSSLIREVCASYS